ncbi:fusicoccadiene synthase [Apiospora marii]|uniref:Fusicoccadiene synthase n=1 Tax=Apiospora marii TaxID=335849 RepID=A0ABR1R9V5_9PEZI
MSKPSSFIRNSIPLPRHAYEGEEYFCRFTPRIHRGARLADAGSWQCQVDFLESSTEARADANRNKDVTSYAVGCINPVVGNFTALCACEARSDRLALTTYMVEYAYIHDDVIEYAENKGESELQAKMVMELMDVDKTKAKECLRLWREMSDVFVQIRDLKFTVLDDYLKCRIVDAGCPWTMSLLCFSMDFTLTADETEKTSAITWTAYSSWVLVNDYFSWEKEWKNHQANGGTGLIANAIFLFTQWYSVDNEEAKKMLRKEIMAREETYCRLKDEFVAAGLGTEKTLQWLELLDLVTAGNFAWSMTTARYRLGGRDDYPKLRRKASTASGTGNSLGHSISDNSAKLADKIDMVIGDRKYLDVNTPEPEPTTRKFEPAVVDQRPLALAQPGFTKSHVSGDCSLQKNEALILQPQQYLETMPSKDVRNAIIDGLEVWYHVPEKSLAVIRDIVALLHSSSLMIDDVQDGSQLRRGFPATHVVFGVSQTINAANLLLMKALKAAESLSPLALRIMIERLIDGHIGQGIDLYWTHHTEVPTEEEYFTMVDGKTGSLFILLAELMRSEATAHRDLDAGLLMKLVGRFFQARDDYQNLNCDEYAQQKGFADDLGEGKISLPLVHALATKSPHQGRLRSILQQRKAMVGGAGAGGLSYEVRKLALSDIKATGGLESAKKTAMGLQEAINETLTMYEDKVGEKNWLLRLAQKRLEVD